MDKVRVATAWLGGCSGCHMSFLDLDERLIDLAQAIDVVYSPFVDTKTFPDGVDITLVEGAVANDDHLRLIRAIRARTKTLISFGDCAVTGNVTALRNVLGRAEPVLQRAYADGAVNRDGAVHRGQMPPDGDLVPALLDRVLPVHHVVAVDVYLPGCPPSADLIFSVLGDLLAGRKPDLAGLLKYG